MKYLKTFEYLMNDKLYKIEVFDKSNPDKSTPIAQSTVTGRENDTTIESDFEKSEEFSNIKKKNPNADLIIKVSRVHDSITNFLDKKKY
jgi:hypothetical protein